MIFLSETHYFGFSVGCGDNTNTCAELLALWSVLRVSLLMGLPLQLVLGDSMVIITWVKRLATLEIPSLKHWCDEIFSMLHTVPPVTFDHIFREHNKLADSLSKKALNLEMGKGYFTETWDDMVIGEGYFTLF